MSASTPSITTSPSTSTLTTGPDLKALREEAGVGIDLMARALHITVAGLRVMEGRRTALIDKTVAKYQRRLVLARDWPLEVDVPDEVDEVKVSKPRLKVTVPKPTPGPALTVEVVEAAIIALSLKPGECFDAIDLVHRLPFDVSPAAVEVTLRSMAKRGIIRSTTYWGGNAGYGPARPFDLDPIDLDHERRRVEA
jgi:hypothetical protein